MNFTEQLNAKQHAAVTTQQPYVRIIAGAGSGKTRVLTFRLAYLAKEKNILPEAILAITFTNKVAREMLSRASELVPHLNGRLKIMTYHSFAARFLRREIHALGYPSSFTILDDDDQEKLVKTIAEEKGFRRGDDIVKQALRYIAEQKSQGIAPEQIRIEYERFPTEKLCLEFYHAYEAKLARMANLDFDDLLIKTIQILEQFPLIRSKWQQQFLHILIDEFQDTNDVQYRLLTLLLRPETSLYVVGDPDQTIYSWRGANPSIIMDLEKQYPIETIILDQNYRSTKPILDLANRLIDHNRYRVKKDLFTESTTGEPIVHLRFFDRDEEARAVVNSIHQRLLNGTKPSEIAILYRANYLTLPFEKELVRRQIPFRIFGGMRFYQRQEIKDVVAYFKLLVNPKDDLSFERIINVPRRGIGDVTFQQLKHLANVRNLSLYETTAGLEMFADSPAKLKTQLLPMIATMAHYRIRFETEGIDLQEEAEAYLHQLGYLESLKTLDEDGRLENVQTLLDDLGDFMNDQPEATFTQYLENISLLSAQDDIEEADFISLMTVHTAKGLEFRHVYVIGLNEGVFPSVRTLNDDAFRGLEEERRLCYVAFTRARQTLTLTCAGDFSFVIQGNLVPSRFFKEAGLTFPRDLGQGYSHDRQTSTTFSSRLGTVKPMTTAPTSTTAKAPRPTTYIPGDRVHHESFGEGVVIAIVSDDIIEVHFTKLDQRKKILSNHSKLHKGQTS
jgi:DNA helicase II / ATP-dependent DNA helicase PcrA